MEWVDGELLSRFVGSRLDQPDALRRVAAQWRGGPAASLRGLRIAHNDLQAKEHRWRQANGDVADEGTGAEASLWPPSLLKTTAGTAAPICSS